MEYRILGKTGLKISRMGFGGIPIQRIDAEGTKVLLISTDLSVEEIQKGVEERLYYDEFQWLQQHPEVHYRSRHLAEGLENILTTCPTCGRTEIDLIGMAEKVEEHIQSHPAAAASDIKVAVMGCVVNGPGEAREADIGLAGGRGKGVIFRKGQVLRSVNGEEALLAAFLEELDKLLTHNS